MEKYERQFFAFNTQNVLTASCEGPDAMDAAVELCDRYEHLFSRTRPDSGLSRVNRAHGAKVKVEPELAGLIDTALDYCRASGGLYDVTMGSVTRLWDFTNRLIPTKREVTAALEHVDWQGVHVENGTVWMDDPEAFLDLGGIAKGYIADKLVELLESRGAQSICVNLGGNVAVSGVKPDGTHWGVGLRNPRASVPGEATTAFAAVYLDHGSVVTSGIYERSFTRDGQLYHHILDPNTGFPAKTDLLGATLVANTSLDADGYTTALIIMGLDRAVAFVNEHVGLEAIFVTTDHKVIATHGIGHTIPFQMAQGA